MGLIPQEGLPAAVAGFWCCETPTLTHPFHWKIFRVPSLRLIWRECLRTPSAGPQTFGQQPSYHANMGSSLPSLQAEPSGRNWTVTVLGTRRVSDETELPGGSPGW